MVISHWSLVIGNLLLVTCYLSLVTCHLLLVTCHLLLVTLRPIAIGQAQGSACHLIMNSGQFVNWNIFYPHFPPCANRFPLL
jgi:hypothetical protein